MAKTTENMLKVGDVVLSQQALQTLEAFQGSNNELIKHHREVITKVVMLSLNTVVTDSPHNKDEILSAISQLSAVESDLALLEKP